MWRFVCISSFVLLSGCGSTDFFSNPSGVGIPAPSTIRGYATETISGTTVNESTGRRMPAGAYLIASVGYTNEKCHEFFDALEKYKQDSAFIDQIITAGIAAGSPLLALAGAPTGAAVARLTSSLSFANQVNKFSADVYAFGTFREQLKGHVFESMVSYQKSKGLDLLAKNRVGIQVLDEGETSTYTSVHLSNGSTIRLNPTRLREFFDSEEPVDLMVARNVAADYASLCSLANMKKIVVDALSNTTTQVRSGSIGSPTGTETVAENDK